MSAWEYFVGWFLEVTTHIKYWDYSMYRFNLKGRICLWVCLVWGLLSYVCIFWIHPPVAALFAQVSLLTRQIVAIVLAVAVLADAIATVRELALMTKVLNTLEKLSGELQLQVSLGKLELSDRLSDAKGLVTDKLHGARDMVTDTLQDAKQAMATLLPDSVTDAGSKLKARYNDLVASAERQTRRLRNIYHPHTPSWTSASAGILQPSPTGFSRPPRTPAPPSARKSTTSTKEPASSKRPPVFPRQSSSTQYRRTSLSPSGTLFSSVALKWRMVRADPGLLSSQVINTPAHPQRLPAVSPTPVPASRWRSHGGGSLDEHCSRCVPPPAPGAHSTCGVH